ncbi:MAG: M23 family metallopeptidase [Deltaproteobacteria bacterium]|jgi:murein DD-endopeptidase MepM/ murein hydrolase activator NlpD|nr:M23 family metallopeptidase [Deltaproteobacteria bacterium]
MASRYRILVMKEDGGVLKSRSLSLACWVPRLVLSLGALAILFLAAYSYHSHKLLLDARNRGSLSGILDTRGPGHELQVEALTERLRDLEARVRTLSRREGELALLTRDYNMQLGLPEGSALEAIWPELVNTVSWTWGGRYAQGGVDASARSLANPDRGSLEAVRGLHRDLDRLVESAEATELALSELSSALRGSEPLLAVTPYSTPVPNGRVSSLFGYRASPFRGGGLDFHQGLDLSAPAGSPVYAPAGGVVLSSDWSKSGYGLMITLDHGFGLSTRYAHLSESLVSPGDQVERGDLIGKVGSTGRSTGPHLHYETLMGGVAVDPRGFIRGGPDVTDELLSAAREDPEAGKSDLGSAAGLGAEAPKDRAPNSEKSAAKSPTDASGKAAVKSPGKNSGQSQGKNKGKGKGGSSGKRSGKRAKR